MIKTNNLTKDFGNNKGIFNVNIEINKGQIVGLIGPNGAGKSTLINMLTGLTFPSFGSFKLFNLETNPNTIYSHMSKMGIMLSETKEIGNMDANRIFKRYHTLQSQKLNPNLPKNFSLKKEIQRLSNIFQVQYDKPFDKLSLGNKKKITIVKMLAHLPDLIILDEPTSGLDPLIQQKLLKELIKVKERGGSILLSSHVLKEVEDICDKIIMVKDGNIISQDETTKLLQNSYKIILLPINYLDEIQKINKSNTKFEIKTTIKHIIIFTNDILPILNFANKNKIQELVIREPSLEELFLEKY